MPQNERVAVIGGGTLGLMAVKEFRDDGFDVIGFETRPYLGGLWKDTDDNTLSVHPTTIFNSSKFRCGFSDFPFPEETDTYPSASQLHNYLESYADHFDIRRHFRVGHRVKQIVRSGNRWEVPVENVKTGRVDTEYFDRVCIATGSFCGARQPKFQGIEKFQGKVLHSIDFRGPEPFKNENVLIIGLHASAQDITNILSKSAKHVYLSHRHGLLMLPKFNPDGTPFDLTLGLRAMMFQTWCMANLPGVWNWVIDRFARKQSEAAFPKPASWGLDPPPSMAVATPLMSDMMYGYLKSGFAEPVSAVKEITGPKTVTLTDGRVLENIDTIIFCTGYHVTIPDGLVPKSKDANSYHPHPDGPHLNPHLYMNMFPLAADPAIRNSLAFVGQGATLWPGFTQFELQVMALSQVWRGRSSLPPHDEMLQWHAMHSKNRQDIIKQYNLPEGNIFYTGMLPYDMYLPWVNQLAGTGVYETFGGKCNGLFNWRTWSLWWQDREIYDLCVKGPFNPVVFRLVETDGRKALNREEVRKMLKKNIEILDRSCVKKRQEMGLEMNGKKNM